LTNLFKYGIINTEKGEPNPSTKRRKKVDTMSTSKVTNKSALNFVLEHYDVPTDVAEKLKGMVAAIERKSAAPKKPTAAQEANEGIKATIVAFLAENFDRGFTVTEIGKSVDELGGYSNQKLSALLRQLRMEGKVENYTEKRKTYFKIVG
jgi:hypothetical protein